MSCEMCGKFAGPDLEECEIDGVRMLVCPKCSRFSSKNFEKAHELEDQEKTEYTFVRKAPGEKGASLSHVKPQRQFSPNPPLVRKRRLNDILESEDVLVDNYGQVIKETRMKNGWSLEEFAQLINEKASIMQKIEKNEFNPSESLITKIERKLDISLRESVTSPIYQTNLTSKKDTTLGDVVKLKKKK